MNKINNLALPAILVVLLVSSVMASPVLAAPTVIESFEDGDLTEYVDTTDGAAITSEWASDGDYSVELGSADVLAPESGSGAPVLSAGDSFSVDFRQTASDGIPMIRFGEQSIREYYGISFDFEADSIHLRAGSQTLLPETPLAEPIEANETYTVWVDWGESGAIDVAVLDSSGSEIDTVSVEDTTYSSGSIGALYSASMDDKMWVDNFRLQDSEYVSEEPVNEEPNSPPIADAGPDKTIHVNPTTSEAEGVVLDGSGSSDPDGDNLTYEWSLVGNGTVSSFVQPDGETVEVSSNDVGETWIELTVSDGSASDTDVAKVVFEQKQPTIDQMQVTTDDPTTGSDTSFYAEASDPDGDSLTYEWDFGNGDTNSGQNPSTVYGTSGDYTVELTVNDGHGGTATESIAVSVAEGNNDPTADIAVNRTSAEVGEVIEFDASGSSDPDGDDLGYSWDLDGDGMFDDASEKVITHAFASTGTHTVGLSVGDYNGSTDTTTVDITVTEAVYDVTIEVVDNATGDLISEATVEISDSLSSNDADQTGTTGSDGTVSLVAEGGSAVQVTANAADYNESSLTHTFAGDGESVTMRLDVDDSAVTTPTTTADETDPILGGDASSGEDCGLNISCYFSTGQLIVLCILTLISLLVWVKIFRWSGGIGLMRIWMIRDLFRGKR